MNTSDPSAARDIICARRAVRKKQYLWQNILQRKCCSSFLTVSSFSLSPKPYVFSFVTTESYLQISPAFLGKTSLLFISPGEKFHLAWGPDPELRLQRSRYEKRKKKALSNWEEIIYYTTLYISNIGGTKKQIKVQERIPVSEVESVKISLDTAAMGKDTSKPDLKGMFFRNLGLKPYGHEKIEYNYIMKKVKKVSGV